MSTIKKDVVSQKTIEEEYVSPEKKQQALQTALYEISKNHPFLGMILQCLDMYYTHHLPTAGIAFNNDMKKWTLYINPKYFCDKLEPQHRTAVLLHELYHLTHKHIIRAPLIKLNPNRRTLMNIAMDMSINQLIKDLPKGCNQCPSREDMQAGAKCENTLCPGWCIDVNDYSDVDASGKKTTWEKAKSFEFYYHKLIEKYQKLVSDESGEGEGQDRKGKGKGLPGEFDSHDWDSNSDESDMMGATEELVKRAMQKQGLTYDRLPGFLKDLLDEIESRRSELDYRGLILSAIKRHASGQDRKYTWTKPSRRYGNVSPGTKIGDMPKMEIFLDTSGSISTQELNDFLDIADEFMKVGARKCQLGLWHTDLYVHEQYRLGTRLDKEKVQSGGTDPTPVLKKIAENMPDFAIIVTDGCYSNVDFESMLPPNTPFPQILWIISQDGIEVHPLQRLGETVKIPKTSALKKDGEF